MDGPNVTAGRLEIWTGVSWNLVCADGWNDLAAHTACREMQYYTGIAITHSTPGISFGYGNAPYWMTNVTCKIPSLGYTSTGLKLSSRLYCSFTNATVKPFACSSGDAGISCFGKSIERVSTFCQGDLEAGVNLNCNKPHTYEELPYWNGNYPRYFSNHYSTLSRKVYNQWGRWDDTTCASNVPIGLSTTGRCNQDVFSNFFNGCAEEEVCQIVTQFEKGDWAASHIAAGKWQACLLKPQIIPSSKRMIVVGLVAMLVVYD